MTESAASVEVRLEARDDDEPAGGVPEGERARPASLDNETFALICRHMATLVGRRDPDLEDFVQLAAEQYLRSLPSFESRCSHSTWVFRVCYSTVLNQRRWYRRWLARFGFSAHGELPDVPTDVDTSRDLEWLEREERVRQAVRRLSPKHQVVVTLHDLQGMTVEQIAEIVEANVLTVRSRLRDGRRDLARRLARDPYFGDRACQGQRREKRS